jgi:hypothetical protein
LQGVVVQLTAHLERRSRHIAACDLDRADTYTFFWFSTYLFYDCQ